jgi:hypothetical protein
MKTYVKILSVILWISIIGWIVYASITTASERKSAKLPWQWVNSSYYDSAHNVWTSSISQTRFSWEVWSLKATTSVVRDAVTWLMWESITSTTTKTWNDAKIYCANLTTGWFSDWRLPNIRELLSIVDYSRQDWTGYNYNSYFTLYDLFWTSTIGAKYPNTVQVVSFTNGSSYDIDTSPHYVLCTR